MNNLKNIIDAVLNGDDEAIKEYVKQALDNGISAMEIINQGIVAGLDVVGQRFQAGETFIPDMILSAMSADAGIKLATSDLKPGELKPRGTMVLGTVKGDTHDIGKNLVALVLRSRGLEVIDLGVDVHDEEFVAAIREHQPQFLGMSALLSTTMRAMRSTIDALEQEQIRHKVKVLVGGAALDQEFASEIGADAYAKDIGEACIIIERLLKGKTE